MSLTDPAAVRYNDDNDSRGGGGVDEDDGKHDGDGGVDGEDGKHDGDGTVDRG